MSRYAPRQSDGRDIDDDHMGSDRETLLFETYKLHAELAERAASLREDLNKLYIGMVTAIIAATVLMQRFGADSNTQLLMPFLGILASLCWLFSLHSLTGRLTAKQKVLVALEAELPFTFLKRENEEFDQSRYIRRKYTARLMPAAFFATCTVWLIANISTADETPPAQPAHQAAFP